MFVPLFFGSDLFRPFSVRIAMATTETADYGVPQVSQQSQPMQLETQDDSQPDASQQTVALEGQPPAPASPFEALEIRLKDNPYDSNAWQDLINLAEDSGDFARITNAYEALLKVYPNLVSLVVLPSSTCTILCENCFPLCTPNASLLAAIPPARPNQIRAK
jgi:hypothetical protein